MIPKNIAQYWDGPIEDELRCLMESWKQLNPNYKYECFDRSSALKFLSENYPKSVVDAFSSARLPAMASDIFRVAWCLKKGGVYIDSASRCLSPLSEWIVENAHMVLMRKWHGGVWNGFIAAEKNSKVLKKILDRIVSNINNRTSNNVWLVTGPGVWKAEKVELDPSVLVIPQNQFKDKFALVNKLKHKEGDAHWSQRQKTQSIFNDYKSSTEIYIHLGPHKTASTNLQTLLELNETELNANSIGLVTVRCKNSIEYHKARNIYTRALQRYLSSINHVAQRNSCIDEMAVALREMVAIFADSHKAVIISDENLLGPIVGHRFAGSYIAKDFYGAAFAVADAIEAAFPENLSKIVLCKRERNSWLASAYRDFISKLQEPLTPRAFMNRLSINFHDQYEEFYSFLSLRFQNRISIIQFEDLIKLSSSELLETFFDALNLELNITPCFNENLNVNSSMKWGAVEKVLNMFDDVVDDKSRKTLANLIRKDPDCENVSEQFMDEVREVFFK